MAGAVFPSDYSLIKAILVCAAPKGMVFSAPFWSENEYRLYPFRSGIAGMVCEETTRVFKRIYRFNIK